MVRSGRAECVEDVDGPVTEVAVGGGDVGAAAEPDDDDRSVVQGGHDLWYSGKYHRHGGSVQVLSDPRGFPLWVSVVRPGSTHDLTAARAAVAGWDGILGGSLDPRVPMQALHASGRGPEVGISVMSPATCCWARTR